MSARFAHAMPFGAALRGDGSVRFRLWAPALPRVTLELPDKGRAIPMTAQADGWFELVTDAAGPGDSYGFRLDDGLRIPDPASRAQAGDVHGPSLVVDPEAYLWRTADWRGRPWAQSVLYELHVGSFAGEGGFAAVRSRLDHLADLGVTAVELMPVADFAGRRNWGYDGVLPFAPARAYGAPDDLKRLVDEAHGRGLMVFLDVVYNHFGPEGNYLHLSAPSFFTERHHTPWGAAIDFSVPAVRDFFVHNALYWLEEYRIDGLRLDAVHAIHDEGQPHFLSELAERLRTALPPERQVHLVLENDANESRHLERDADGRPRHYTAQWNDDLHHAAHGLLTGEAGGYYADYAERPLAALARALAEGFVYQGEPSAFRGGRARGEPSRHLPPDAFVGFLQNHDQVGNRAFGERLGKLCAPEPLAALSAVLLLAPPIPLLFMGEEWAATTPFLYFTDYEGELAAAVREGRRAEFGDFPAFADPAQRARIPDPNDPETFRRSRLDWREAESPAGAAHLAFVRRLLALRGARIAPRLAGAPGGSGAWRLWGERGLAVTWTLGDASRLTLTANLGEAPADGAPTPAGDLLFAWPEGLAAPRGPAPSTLPPWSLLWHLAEGE